MEKITNTRLYCLLVFNVLLILLLGYKMLNTLEKDVIPQKVEEVQPKANASQQKDKLKEHSAPTTVTDVSTKDTLGKVENPKVATPTANGDDKESKQKNDVTNKDKTGITFYTVIWLMLLSGGMGGVLCNLRGFFIHFRGEEASFPAKLEIPYYVRPILSAGAGIFVYFVANFLVTSITNEYSINDVSFQALVSFVALAMLSGFGSLEFFQRLKETAMTLFGQKAEKDRWQRLEDLYKLQKAGILSEEEYKKEKEKILNNMTDTDAAMQKVTGSKQEIE